jgi:hypothetical protein
MIIVWTLFLLAVLMPFLEGLYVGLGAKDPYPTFSKTVDEELKKQTAEAKRTADILQKNRTDSWTNPDYFKK